MACKQKLRIPLGSRLAIEKMLSKGLGCKLQRRGSARDISRSFAPRSLARGTLLLLFLLQLFLILPKMFKCTCMFERWLDLGCIGCAQALEDRPWRGNSLRCERPDGPCSANHRSKAVLWPGTCAISQSAVGCKQSRTQMKIHNWIDKGGQIGCDSGP